MRCALFIIIVLLTATCKDSGRQFVWSTNQNGGAIELLLDSAYNREIKLFAEPSVVEFYKAREFAQVWSKNNVLIPAADSLIYCIRNAPYCGLLQEDYHLNEIEGILRSSIDSGGASVIDILLTDSFLSMAYHLKNGRLEKGRLVRIRKLTTPDTLLMTSLNRAVEFNLVKPELESFEPAHVNYAQLKKTLHYKLTSLYHDSLLAREDQSLLMGEIEKISINMERWRWEIKKIPARYILINIPAYNLRLIEDNRPVLESKVIVGTPEKPTPILSSIIECFIIYPYWHVPRGIATTELLPEIQNDTSFIQRHNFDILDSKGNLHDSAAINWNTYNENYFPFILRQREGIDNALGVLKFVFENPYGVYLHDTNAKYLFSRKMRALSHGCIRLEKARELAHYLICNDNSYCTPQDLERYLTMKIRREIRVKNPIPIYVRYYTADSQNLYDDIYEKDEMLRAAIYDR